jgi:hypothetical protein
MKKKQNEKSQQYADAKSKQGTSQKEMSAKFPEPNRGSFQRNSSSPDNAKASKSKTKDAE